MTKTKTVIILMAVLLLCSLFIIASTDLFIPRENNEVYDISVIVNDSKADSWSNFRSGLDQAAKEKNANISFITLYDENNLDQQIVLLEREIAGGADAILISAADSDGLSHALEDMVIDIPIIAIGSGVKAKQIRSYISANNFEMGEKLAKEIVANANQEEKVLIIKNSMSCSDIFERYEGLLSVLNESTNNYEVLDLNNIVDPQAIGDKLSYVLSNTSSTIVVSLDELIQEQSLDVVERLKIQNEVKLYGIGHTNRIVYNIEMDIIDGIVIQNMFNVGYLGIQEAIDAILKKEVEDTIEIEMGIINKDNMYSIENQRLLFPVP